MPSVLFLAAAEITRDPRARRAARAAAGCGYDARALCIAHAGEREVPLAGLTVTRVGAAARGAPRLGAPLAQGALERELRGLWRLGRLAVVTVRLVAAARALPPADVVHAHDLDALPAAALVARRTAARLVYDAHELAADQEGDPPRLQRAAVTWLERRLARRADAVVTVSEPIAVELERRLGLRARPLVVANCPPLEATPADSTPGDSASAGPLRVVYQGGVGIGRPLDELVAAARLVAGARVSLRVAGVASAALRAALDPDGSAPLDVLDAVGPDEVVAALAGFDAGVVLITPRSRNDELGFPNKLFEYLMAGLAVVAPALPGIAPLVVGEGVGVTFEPGSAASLAAALAGLAADRPALAVMRARARALAVERWNAEAQRPALLAAWAG